MVRNHLKRTGMPLTWATKEKKRIYWIAKTRPGAHPMDEGMPIVVALREILGYASTSREVKQILNHKNILIDGTRRKDHRFNIGLMDVLSVQDLDEHFRISLDKHGKLNFVKIDKSETKSKICKIKNKTQYKGKVQLTLSDGRNLLLDKKAEYNTADSVVISLPDQKITSHIKFEKGAFVLLTEGRKRGTTGTIEEINGKTVKIKSKDGEFETLKKYCFAVGKQKPVLTI